MTKKLLFVPTDQVYDYLGYVEKYVRPAHSHGINERSWGQLVGQILMGQVLFWLAFDDGKVVGAATTEIIDYSNYRCVHLITIGADNGAGFEDFHYELEEYAKKVNATRIKFWGRHGWTRALNKVAGQNGEKYEEVYRVFSMEITNNANDSTPEPGHEASEPLGDGPTEK